MVKVIRGNVNDVIASGALSIVRAAYGCEQCGTMYEKAYVLHKDDDLNGALREVPEGLEGMLGATFEEAMDGMDEALDAALDSLGDSAILNKLEERGLKMLERHMEGSKRNVEKKIETLERRIRKDDYFFLPKVKCEKCGHKQSWMGRRTGFVSMLGFLGVIAVLGVQLYGTELVWAELHTRQLISLGLMALFGLLMVRSGLKLALGGNEIKSRPRVTFDAIKLKLSRAMEGMN